MLRISCTQREVYATTLALGKFARSDRSQSTVSISFKSERCRVSALQTKRYHLSDLHSTYETLLWSLCPNKEHSSSASTATFPQRCNFGLSRKRAQQAITEHYVTKAEHLLAERCSWLRSSPVRGDGGDALARTAHKQDKNPHPAST